MRLLLLIGALSFLVFITPAFALNITLSLDKTKVFMGDNITLAGKIAFDNGTATKFDYRAAVVAPKRVIVCDTNKTTTTSDGSFTLKCKIPTAQEATSLWIPASERRSVIPYVAGVAVKDPEKNETVKKHAQTIIALNKDKLDKELDAIVRDLDNFVNHSQRFIPECDAIAEKATRFNVTIVTTKCLQVQQRINDLIANATAISDQAKQIKANVTSIEELRDSLKILKESLKDMRDELKDVKDAIKSVRWETLREVKKSVTEIKQEVEKKREEIKELKNKSKEIKSRECTIDTDCDKLELACPAVVGGDTLLCKDNKCTCGSKEQRRGGKR